MAEQKRNPHSPSIRHKINVIIFGSDTPAGKWFDIGLLIVIILSILGVMLESIPSIRRTYEEQLFAFEWGVTLIFSLEYFLRILSTEKPLRYFFSFYGLIDLFSLLPTYIGIFISGTQPLRVLRCVRLLRVFRILNLSRFVEGAATLTHVLKNAKNRIVVFLMAVSMLVIVLGTVMYLIEDESAGFTSIPRSIYWAIVTLTTVGYGDIAPATALGQFIASIVMILGYAIIVVPTGIVTNALVKNAPVSPREHSSANCAKTRHDADALYCKYCGRSLHSIAEADCRTEAEKAAEVRSGFPTEEAQKS